MAQQIQKALARGAGTAVLVSIYTAPASTRTFIKALTVSNPTGAPVTLVIKVQQDPGLDTGTFRNAIPGLALGTLQTYVCPELVNQMVSPGGQIQLSGNGLEFLMSGVEIVG